ncbi:MAG: C-terminal binding protein [Chloroflexi bacterium]|nr:MAG: C-terminal binding protein [Chloroflexota bacterium]
MIKRKVVITDYIEPDLDWETRTFDSYDIDFAHYQLKNASREELLDAVKDAEIIVVNMARFDEALISGLNKTQLIIRHGIGYDNVDIDAAARKGITVINIPDYCVPEVAEQAVMLIVACQRKLTTQLHSMQCSTEAGKWVFEPVYPVYQLQGKTVGIVGLGRIGGTVFRMLQGFGVKFLVCDPYLSKERKKEYGIETCSLEDLLQNSDIVTIHCPLKWEETYHMFDTLQFKMMKKTAILVNTARGAIVNLETLDQALRAGEIAQAGIDVYEVEPPSADLPLLHNERAICTPHLSWLSEESGWTIREKIMEQIRRYMDGETVQNILTVPNTGPAAG